MAGLSARPDTAGRLLSLVPTSERWVEFVLDGRLEIDEPLSLLPPTTVPLLALRSARGEA